MNLSKKITEDDHKAAGRTVVSCKENPDGLEKAIYSVQVANVCISKDFTLQHMRHCHGSSETIPGI